MSGQGFDSQKFLKDYFKKIFDRDVLKQQEKRQLETDND